MKKYDIVIKNVLFYKNKEKVNIGISEGKIQDITNSDIEGEKIIDGKYKLIVMPSLVDIHVHTREPGEEYKEDLNSVSKSAVCGGFGVLVAMANTKPAMDNVMMVEGFYNRSNNIKDVKLYTYGAVTIGRKGEVLTEMATLSEAGAVGFSDDGDFIVKSDVMRRAIEYAKCVNKIIVSHAEDPYLSADGQINESIVSQSLGLTGIPSISESVAVYRDSAIAKWVKGRVHFAHISTSWSLDVLRLFKDYKGITAETSPHYLYFSDEELKSYNTNFKMKPPLRRPSDVESIKKALKDGLLQVIATDHAPHAFYEKNLEFNYAPFGIVGLETALSAVYEKMVLEGDADFNDIINWMNVNPAKIVGIENPVIEKNKNADIILFDPDKEWVVDRFYSQSSNSPWYGKKLKGKVVTTIKNGNIVFYEE